MLIIEIRLLILKLNEPTMTTHFSPHSIRVLYIFRLTCSITTQTTSMWSRKNTLNRSKKNIHTPYTLAPSAPMITCGLPDIVSSAPDYNKCSNLCFPLHAGSTSSSSVYIWCPPPFTTLLHIASRIRLNSMRCYAGQISVYNIAVQALILSYKPSILYIHLI